MQLIRESGETLTLALVTDREAWAKVQAEFSQGPTTEAAVTAGSVASGEQQQQQEQHDGGEQEHAVEDIHGATPSVTANGAPVREVRIRRGERGYGFRLAGNEGTAGPVFIAGVVPGGPADAAKALSHGDRILAINEHNVEHVSKGEKGGRKGKKRQSSETKEMKHDSFTVTSHSAVRVPMSVINISILDFLSLLFL